MGSGKNGTNLRRSFRGSQSASSRYWYDLAGNLITSIVKNVTNCYYYNVQNKLVKIVGTNFVNEFQYNSRSERIAVGIGPCTNSLIWRYDACQGPVTLAEFNSNSEMTRWYVRGLGVAQGIGDVIAEVEVLDSPPKPHYYLSNHRGDTLVVLNPDGAANSTFRYDAFGNCYAAAGPFAPRYTFSTKEYLEQAQLYLYQHRPYDVAAGRWTQRDPIDYQDLMNLYCFCANSVLAAIDADGRDFAFHVNSSARSKDYGHTTLYFQSKGKWYKYNQGAASAPVESSGDLSFALGLDAPAGVTIEPVKSPPKGAVVFKSTAEEDEQISFSAVRSMKEHNSGLKDYNHYFNNCTQAAVDVINDANLGRTVRNAEPGETPDEWFSDMSDKARRRNNH